MYLGLDGFRGGWCCCRINNEVSIELYENISDLVIKNENAIFIDIPIGLTNENKVRKIDVEVRKLLPKNKKSSVFTPPCREALKMKNYSEGNNVNKKITGKGISIQSWNIGKKIKEIDGLLRNNKILRNIIHESHPELCFSSSITNPLKFNKKTIEGFNERKTIISSYIPNVDTLIEETINKKAHHMVKKDDIIDSIILAISAKKWKENGSRIIKQEVAYDEYEIPFSVYY